MCTGRYEQVVRYLAEEVNVYRLAVSKQCMCTYQYAVSNQEE